MERKLFETAAAEMLSRFDPSGDRKSLVDRPFIIELFGTPKSGKSTMKEMIKHSFKRNGWSVSTPTEGAEVVEWTKRLEPQYNFQTAEYALSRVRELCCGPLQRSFHVAILDRGNMDGVVRMDHYVARGVISEAERQAIESYYLLSLNEEMFDLHVCLVASPEVAIQRELARAIVKKHGETMNPKTLTELLDAHRRVWDRLDCGLNPSMCWHDSSKETEAETATSLLETILDAFERRLAAIRGG